MATVVRDAYDTPERINAHK